MFSQLAILADVLQSLTFYLLRWDVMPMLLYLSLLGIFIEMNSLSTWQGGACIRAWSLCSRISINTRWLATDTDPGTQHRPGSGPSPWYLAWHWHSQYRPRIQTITLRLDNIYKEMSDTEDPGKGIHLFSATFL